MNRPVSILRPARASTVRVSAVFGGFGKGGGKVENESVKNLLQRDVKKVEVKLDSLDDVVKKMESEDALSSPSSKGAPEGKKGGKKGEEQEKKREGPATAGEAIRLGLARYQEKRFQEAIDLFNLSLELPGNGVMRAAGSIREIACPSDAEEQSALYNLACAYTALQQYDAALLSLRGALEAGLDQFKTVREDPDLAALRSAKAQEFSALVGEFESPLRKIFGKKDGQAVPQKKGLGRFYVPW